MNDISRQWKVEKTERTCTIYTSRILDDDAGEWSCNFQSLPFKDAAAVHDVYANDQKYFKAGFIFGHFFGGFLATTPHLDNVTDDHRYIHGSWQIFRVSELVSF